MADNQPTTGRRCHNCHGPTTATISRCPACRSRRRSQDRAYHREIADALFPPAVRAALLGRVASGEHISDVCADLGITVNRARSYAAYAPAWGRALDRALIAGRDPDLAHSTETAYRRGRCRCPDCRTAKNAARSVPGQT
ncbi:hypothetical protein [Streptomyces sp. NPDC060187]|uniref:hypothetical protein n=1 Tax=Streptomyces sp. NPDC060187 TaxID=3347067 RepID=UPI0036694874